MEVGVDEDEDGRRDQEEVGAHHTLQPSQRRILLQPLQASLESGDRLRVSIAGAAWPAIGVNPGCSDVPCGAPGPHHRVVTLTLQLADSTLQLIPFNSGRLQLD